MNIIITTSGLGSRLFSHTKYQNKSLINVGDKAAIDYIIKLFKDKNVNFIITLGYYADFVKQYLEIAYPGINFIFVYINKYQGNGSSLLYSLLCCKDFIKNEFYYICCDTIIDEKISFEFNENTLFVSNCTDGINYSSINCKNSQISKINKKGCNNFDYIYIGMAFIKNYELFFKIAEEIYNNDSQNQSLSDIDIYSRMLELNINFNFNVINKYYDTGNLNSYNNTLLTLKKKYNVLTKEKESIYFHNDKVIKFFYDNEKVNNLIKRYNHISDFCPKILNFSKNFYSMELIDSKPLSQIYEYGKIYKLLKWAQNNLWKKINTNDNYKINFIDFYKNKTIDRINKYLENIENKDYIIINGINTNKIFELLEKINFEYIYDSSPTNFHGDFILDNILLKNDNFALIDWREKFGNTTEYGDVYYDLGKLRHNIFFNHDNVEQKLYFIKEISKNNVEIDIKCNYLLISQINDFDKFLNENKYDLKKVKLIMALIWINMAPLHEYPLSNFLFNFGKLNLFNELNS